MLSEKCALVTGSTAGLGYAIAESLARAGAQVILNGLAAPGQGEAAAARLSVDTGYEAAFDGANLRDVGAIERMIRGGVARFGTIDIVVNNAVVRHFKPIQDFTAQEWDTSLAVNLSAAFHCVRLALPQMLEQRWGRIINMSSIYSARGVENRVDYVTTKTALLGFTRAIAIETAKTGMTCNAIAPGTVPSPAITERIPAIAAARKISIEEAQRDYLAMRNPSERFVGLENVGALVVFLCSEAAADITGANLPLTVAGRHCDYVHGAASARICFRLYRCGRAPRRHRSAARDQATGSHILPARGACVSISASLNGRLGVPRPSTNLASSMRHSAYRS